MVRIVLDYWIRNGWIIKKAENRLPFYLMVLLLSGTFTGCDQKEIDKDIKAMIATKAKADLNFAGVNYTVADGVVTLSGKCPTDKARTSVETAIEYTRGVKGIVNQITVAPVVIRADQDLKLAVDSVLMDYARVLADISDSVVTLKGQVESKDFQKLMTQMNHLQPKEINNLLQVE